MNAAAAKLLAKQDSARQIEAEIMALTEVRITPSPLIQKSWRCVFSTRGDEFSPSKPIAQLHVHVRGRIRVLPRAWNGIFHVALNLLPLCRSFSSLSRCWKACLGNRELPRASLITLGICLSQEIEHYAPKAKC